MGTRSGRNADDKPQLEPGKFWVLESHNTGDSIKQCRCPECWGFTDEVCDADEEIGTALHKLCQCGQCGNQWIAGRQIRRVSVTDWNDDKGGQTHTRRKADGPNLFGASTGLGEPLFPIFRKTGEGGE
jgi:hypothetical protein